MKLVFISPMDVGDDVYEWLDPFEDANTIAWQSGDSLWFWHDEDATAFKLKFGI